VTSRGWVLVARARHTGRSVVALILFGLAEALLGSASLQLLGPSITLSVPWAVLMPAASAAVIGVGTRSAAGELEATTARPLPALRGAHLAVLLVVGAAATAMGSAGLTGLVTGPAALRNFLGLTGLAVGAAAVLGSGVSWTAPLAMATASATVGAAAGVPRPWAWPIHDDGDPIAAAAAVALLLLGVVLVLATGSREPRSEAD